MPDPDAAVEAEIAAHLAAALLELNGALHKATSACRSERLVAAIEEIKAYVRETPR
jgi:hypothetical protein